MNRNDREFTAQRIRAQYVEQNAAPDALRELQALDARVKRPAQVFAYICGSLAAIIMGAGMSLVMTDIGSVIGLADPLIPGVIVGIVGMVMAIANYPAYNGILSARRKKYADRILALSDAVIGE